MKFEARLQSTTERASVLPPLNPEEAKMVACRYSKDEQFHVSFQVSP
jgi:hypothetical protein